LLAHGRWFFPGTPTKTGRHDIAEIGVKHQKSKINQPTFENQVFPFIQLSFLASRVVYLTLIRCRFDQKPDNLFQYTYMYMFGLMKRKKVY
jgi:hypothetical protein